MPQRERQCTGHHELVTQLFGDQGHHILTLLCSESTQRTHQVTGEKDEQEEEVNFWLDTKVCC